MFNRRRNKRGAVPLPAYWAGGRDSDTGNLSGVHGLGFHDVWLVGGGRWYAWLLQRLRFWR